MFHLAVFRWNTGGASGATLLLHHHPLRGRGVAERSRGSKAECSGSVATTWEIAVAKLAPPRASCREPHRHSSGEAETADRASEGKLEARQLLSARVRCPPATGGRLGLGPQPVATEGRGASDPSEAKTAEVLATGLRQLGADARAEETAQGRRHGRGSALKRKRRVALRGSSRRSKDDRPRPMLRRSIRGQSAQQKVEISMQMAAQERFFPSAQSTSCRALYDSQFKTWHDNACPAARAVHYRLG